MRARWRIFGKDLEIQPEKAIQIIKCTCILHNVIRERDEVMNFFFPCLYKDLHYCNTMINYANNANKPNSLLNERTIGKARRSTNEAQEIRNLFANYFIDNLT